eukprot:22389-Eustigmatos_ZCMA.PRE.1
MHTLILSHTKLTRRLAEGYTAELNMVMVSNRQAHAELVAMLQKLDIVEREKGRAGLVERQMPVGPVDVRVYRRGHDAET